MVDHVKLEIALQLIAEKIADLYKLIRNAENSANVGIYQNELAVAYDQKERIARGEISAIEQILRERGRK